MADPRFYDNRGPFTLAMLCANAAEECPPSADRERLIFDVAGLTQAGQAHLSFFDSVRAKSDFQTTTAGWCLVPAIFSARGPAARTVLIPSQAVGRAFARIAGLFYPEFELDLRAQEEKIDATARIGTNIILGTGVVIGPQAEIGDGTRLGANTVIGRGVTIGRECQIGANVSIAFAHLGDGIVVQPGAVIGGSGFGFFSSVDGHRKTPQLGRVIVQDRVEIGANSAIDRGALSDTVIGEGTKIDNLVQIGHNVITGRHCIMAAQVGISGSVTIGDFVVMGGKVGVADHVTIGNNVRLAALSGVGFNLDGGQDYGGIPARPIGQWKREMALLASLVKKKKSHE